MAYNFHTDRRLTTLHVFERRCSLAFANETVSPSSREQQLAGQPAVGRQKLFALFFSPLDCCMIQNMQ